MKSWFCLEWRNLLDSWLFFKLCVSIYYSSTIDSKDQNSILFSFWIIFFYSIFPSNLYKYWFDFLLSIFSTKSIYVFVSSIKYGMFCLQSAQLVHLLNVEGKYYRWAILIDWFYYYSFFVCFKTLFFCLFVFSVSLTPNMGSRVLCKSDIIQTLWWCLGSVGK